MTDAVDTSFVVEVRNQYVPRHKCKVELVNHVRDKCQFHEEFSGSVFQSDCYPFETISGVFDVAVLSEQSPDMCSLNVMHIVFDTPREKLFEKIRKGHLTYPRYLPSTAQDILQGVSSCMSLHQFRRLRAIRVLRVLDGSLHNLLGVQSLCCLNQHLLVKEFHHDANLV